MWLKSANGTGDADKCFTMRNLMSCGLFIIAICTLISGRARGELALFPVGKMFAFAGHGLYPTGRLMEGADGNLYGTTSAGGKFGCGTVYKITPFVG
jgi:uncharacterized repeat protein (TIGR03803 family)